MLSWIQKTFTILTVMTLSRCHKIVQRAVRCSNPTIDIFSSTLTQVSISNFLPLFSFLSWPHSRQRTSKLQCVKKFRFMHPEAGWLWEVRWWGADMNGKSNHAEWAAVDNIYPIVWPDPGPHIIPAWLEKSHESKNVWLHNFLLNLALALSWIIGMTRKKNFNFEHWKITWGKLVSKIMPRHWIEFARLNYGISFCLDSRALAVVIKLGFIILKLLKSPSKIQRYLFVDCSHFQLANCQNHVKTAP